LSSRAEIDLLIACALPPGHPQIATRVRSSLDSDIAWSKLRALAAYHRVRPLLNKRLAEHASAFVPESVMIALASEFRAVATQNLHMMGELIAVTKVFAAADIPVLPHKGPLLAQIVYSDLALRQFADLDILVHPSDLPAAIALLTNRGYRTIEDLQWLSPSALLRWTGETCYTSPCGVSFDLHWRLTPSHYTVQLDPAILWRSRTLVTISGTALPDLTPEALFLLLAVHGAKHCWESLGWLADAAWLIDANPEFDWQHAVALAEETKCRRPLRLLVSLVRRIFDVPAPDLGEDAAVRKLHERVMARLYTGPAESPRSPELLRFAADLAERRSSTLKHLLGLLFYPTEIDWKTRRLPENLFWLYAPARAVRLLGKYCRSVSSRLV
jgi:hypothetical protein